VDVWGSDKGTLQDVLLDIVVIFHSKKITAMLREKVIKLLRHGQKI